MKAGSGEVRVHRRPTPPMRRPPSWRQRLKRWMREVTYVLMISMNGEEEEAEEFG